MGSRTANPGPFASWELRLATVGVVAVLLARAGLVPGGGLGYDLLLALIGRRFVLAVGRGTSPRAAAARSFAAAWPGAVAAVVLAVGWILLTRDVSHDALVRGEALAVLGGYGNWHQLAFGPSEVAGSSTISPLQGAWAWSVLVQVAAVWLLVWTGVVALARHRAASGRAGRPISTALVISSVVAAAHLLVAVVVVVMASSDGVALSTATRGLGFSGAALVTVALLKRPDVLDRLSVELVRRTALAVFGCLVLVSSWSSGIGVRAGGILAAVVAAALVVSLGLDGAPVERTERGSGLATRPVAALDELVVFTIVWVAGPAMAIGRGDRLGLPWPVGVIVGLVLSGVAVGVTVSAARRRQPGEAALERRRVLGPAGVAVLMIVVFSVTGAFHWDRPMTREQWLCRNEPERVEAAACDS